MTIEQLLEKYGSRGIELIVRYANPDIEAALVNEAMADLRSALKEYQDRSSPQ